MTTKLTASCFILIKKIRTYTMYYKVVQAEAVLQSKFRFIEGALLE